MSSVAATLQELHLHANCFDFRQPGTLTRFTCLHTLSVQTYEEADRICNFSPAVLPPTLCSITILHGQHIQRLSNLARHRPEVHAVFDFPAGGYMSTAWAPCASMLSDGHAICRCNLTFMCLKLTFYMVNSASLEHDVTGIPHTDAAAPSGLLLNRPQRVLSCCVIARRSMLLQLPLRALWASPP